MDYEINQTKIFILDTSAFIAGIDPFSFKEKGVIVPRVKEEIKQESILEIRLKTAIKNGKIELRTPSKQYRKIVKERANELGDEYLLSETDIDLLAIAFELKAKGYTPKIVTDDYSMQNVASLMNIGFISLATSGIKRLLQWQRYCPGCFKKYSTRTKVSFCLICGTKLKRKPKKAKFRNK